MNQLISHTQITLPAQGVRTLCWHGDELIDWVGGTRFGLDGSRATISAPADDAFDGAIGCGPYAVIFERLGVRARLLRDEQVVRDLSRSDYRAEVYEHPACLWRTPDGHTLLAHCPEEYNRIEIEDLDSGKRLTESDHRQPSDFFHSRLASNPSGTRLMSAGWVWHPWNVVGFVELAAALEEPCRLDQFDGCVHSRNVCLAEESSAAWQGDHRIILGASGEGEDDEESQQAGDGPRLRPNGIAVYDIREQRMQTDVVLGYTPGTMMPIGEDRVLTLFEHPRLVSLMTGDVLYEWRDVPSGTQASSIIWHMEPPPPMALDPLRRRFAIVRGDEIVVVCFGDR